MSEKPELFYTIADADCARARKRATELRVLDRLRFRNLAYDEVKTDFAARGGTRVPALWIEGEMVEGIDAVERRLLHMSQAPR